MDEPAHAERMRRLQRIAYGAVTSDRERAAALAELEALRREAPEAELDRRDGAASEALRVRTPTVSTRAVSEWIAAPMRHPCVGTAGRSRPAPSHARRRRRRLAGRRGKATSTRGTTSRRRVTIPAPDGLRSLARPYRSPSRLDAARGFVAPRRLTRPTSDSTPYRGSLARSRRLSAARDDPRRNRRLRCGAACRPAGRAAGRVCLVLVFPGGEGCWCAHRTGFPRGRPMGRVLRRGRPRAHPGYHADGTAELTPCEYMPGPAQVAASCISRSSRPARRATPWHRAEVVVGPADAQLEQAHAGVVQRVRVVEVDAVPGGQLGSTP